jgi:hypothetical protein
MHTTGEIKMQNGSYIDEQRETALDSMRQAGMIAEHEPWPFPIVELQPIPICDLLEPAPF